MTYSWGADVLLIRHKSGSNDNRCYNAKVWLNKYLFLLMLPAFANHYL